METPGLLEKIDDALNPIVVKELRQAVQSRVVIAVLLLFLLLELLFMGIYLMTTSITGSLEAVDFQAGRTVFAVLRGIMLATCMLFLPAYTGFRLAAERADVNVDLLFISTLRPRAIVSGKFLAALLLAILIFSACTPFMAFTYFLRGIDLPSIFLVISLDFLIVMVTVMLAVLLAVVPANRVFKVLLGFVGLLVLLFTLFMTLGLTSAWLDFGMSAFMESPAFAVSCLIVFLGVVITIGFLFTCSVALLSPLSANRTLPLRLWVTLASLLSGLVLAVCSHWVGGDWPMTLWIIGVTNLLSLCLVIAINEREQWAPRVARKIPRQWWLRPWAFLFFSGAAGGVLWASLLFALCWWAGSVLYPPTMLVAPASFRPLAVMFMYTYCYCLTAVFLRRTVVPIAPIYTWVLALVLVAAGSALPFLFMFLFHRGAWDVISHFAWLLTCPAVGTVAVSDYRFPDQDFVFTFLYTWATIINLLNVFWFIGQIRRFRPFSGSPSGPREFPPNILSPTPLEATRTSR